MRKLPWLAPTTAGVTVVLLILAFVLDRSHRERLGVPDIGSLRSDSLRLAVVPPDSVRLSGRAFSGQRIAGRVSLESLYVALGHRPHPDTILTDSILIPLRDSTGEHQRVLVSLDSISTAILRERLDGSKFDVHPSPYAWVYTRGGSDTIASAVNAAIKPSGSVTQQSD
jgi:hypothetical protein